MHNEDEVNICEGVEAIGSRKHFEWIRSVEDPDVRSALMEHVLWCPRCSRINREALSLSSAEIPAEDASWASWLLKPLAEWTAKPAVPNLVYSVANAHEQTPQEWSLEVGEAEDMSPATLRLVPVADKDDSRAVLIQSDNRDRTYVVRGYSGGQKVFEETLKGDRPMVAQLDGTLDSDSQIEVIELAEHLQ
jgi:hypothetical protein